MSTNQNETEVGFLEGLKEKLLAAKAKGLLRTRHIKKPAKYPLGYVHARSGEKDRRVRQIAAGQLKRENGLCE